MSPPSASLSVGGLRAAMLTGLHVFKRLQPYVYQGITGPPVKGLLGFLKGVLTMAYVTIPGMGRFLGSPETKPQQRSFRSLAEISLQAHINQTLLRHTRTVEE